MDFRLLGALEVVGDDGREVAIGSGRQRALLALLLLRANEPLSSDVLVDQLWGEAPPPTALEMLRNQVAALRRVLGAAGRLETRAGGYRLRVREGERDVDRFEALVAAGRESLNSDPRAAAEAFREALRLWRGAALADLAYEPFAQTEAVRLEELRLAAVEERVEADLATGRHTQLVPELQRLVAEHPMRERMHGQLMLALYRAGRQGDALETYRRARDLLVEQLGVEPGPELRKLQQAILSQAAELQAPTSLAAPTRRLPAPLSRMIGRDRERDAVADLLRRRDVRLVTLTGAGGVGKTRLALDVARLVEPDFPDGAWLVSLAATASPEHVAAAIGQELEVTPSQNESPQQAVERVLARKQALLVLDNFEHILAAAPSVSELLGACPALTVLATSRAPLRVEPEHRYAVEPLAVPKAGEPTAVALAPASALFVERARSHDPNFEMTAASAGAVAEICRRLDGLPLAIELAAARITMLDVEELNDRLAHALDVLGKGPRDAPPRQRTLRMTIDWSRRLLSPAEADAFIRFAAFAGGATLDAAQEVTGAGLDTLEGLVEKQLLRRSREAGPARLTMLETVRQYARERLDGSEDAHEIQRRHCQHYLAVAERAEPALVTREGVNALRTLDIELNNLRAAFDWSLWHGDPALALRLAGLTREYWDIRGAVDEGLAWIDGALDAAGGHAPLGDRARACRARVFLLHSKGGVYNAQGLMEETKARTDEAVALSRQAGDAAGIADALLLLSYLHAVDSLPQRRRRALAEEALTYARAAGDEMLVAEALRDCALALPTDEAKEELEQAAAALRKVGNLRRLLGLYNSAGYNAIKECRPERAAALLDEVFPIVHELEDPLAMLGPWGNIGLAALLGGEHDRAQVAFASELQLCHEHGVAWLIPEALGGLAAIAASAGHAERAACLLGVAASYGPVGDADVREQLEQRFFMPARKLLGEEAWHRAETRGASLSPEERIAMALNEVTAVSHAHEPSAS